MKTITLQTKHTTYQIGIHPLGFLLHLYYGARVEHDMSYLLQYYDRGFAGNPYDAGGDRGMSLDFLPQEFPCYGTGDFRSAAFNLRNEEGIFGADLRYQSHAVRTGKYAIPGLPAVYDTEEALQEELEYCGGQRGYERQGLYGVQDSGPEQDTCGAKDRSTKQSFFEERYFCENEESSSDQNPCGKTREAYTVEITLADRNAGVEVLLKYGVLPELDVITRSAVIKNTGAGKIYINKAFSSTLDFLRGDYDLLHFHGRHTMERNLERVPVMHGKQSFGSRRGTSSHQHNPFVILAERGATEDAGGCYGMSLLYSGNFSFEAEQDQYRQTRMQIGMLDEMMDYPLAPQECLYTPEAAMAYSAHGLAALSHIYHEMIRNHVCRGIYKNARRPVLINNWEATYFHFTGENILKLAEQAAELGVEMLVLDDGWFGKRDDDNSGLGDWTVNEKKLGGTLPELVEKINARGLKFGIWIEPEMVNEDSDLYRAHPDWAFRIPGRSPVRCRNQLVLDFSRKEVVDHVFQQIAEVIDSANVEYIKMDMNRSICDVCTSLTEAGRSSGWPERMFRDDRNSAESLDHAWKSISSEGAEKTSDTGYTVGAAYQNYGKVMHGYVLGLYDFLERLTKRYPHILIEGCSGGGGRFDAGMLYYTPQIWCSDDTDAIERIRIQHGTSFGYPISAVGSHVSAVPNHQTGRTTKLRTRGIVAMAGTFGYELDLDLLTDAEKEEIRQQIRDYKSYWELINQGTYYRLHDPETDREAAAWCFVSKDQTEMLLNVVSLDAHGNAPLTYIRCRGLLPDGVYRCEAEARDVKPYTGVEPRADYKGMEGRIFDGNALMHAGVPVPMELGEYGAMQLYFKLSEK